MDDGEKYLRYSKMMLLVALLYQQFTEICWKNCSLDQKYIYKKNPDTAVFIAWAGCPQSNPGSAADYSNALNAL